MTNQQIIIPRFPPVWAEVFGEDRRGIFAECSVDGVSFVWRWVCPGEFMMGSPEDEEGRFEDEGPLHRVVISKGFWLGETPVTQAQWQSVMGENPSQVKGEQRPVESVNWHQSKAFAAKLNDLIPGLHSALPTEAQWEYACRAGTTAAFNDGSACTVPEGDDPALRKLGWFIKNSEDRTHDVKEKDQPNAWGLHDMHGNVWEWCADAWDDEAYAKRQGEVIDPEVKDDDESAFRVLRGGSWGVRARLCRSAYRGRGNPGLDWRNQGLRLAAGQNEPSAAEPPGAERLRPEGGEKM